MKCTFCGQENNDTAKFCNNCGTPFTLNPSSGSAPVMMDTPKSPESGNANTESPVIAETAPTGNTASAAVIPASPVPSPNTVPGTPPRAIPVQPTVTRPSSTGMIVFSVINILCCGSTIFGIIALVFALMATGEMDYNEAKNKLKISKILNIVGVCITALAILFFIAMAIIAIVTGSFVETSTGYESYNPSFF